MSYKKAGVDIDKGNLFVKKIAGIAPGVGGFSGLFPLNKNEYSRPVLVASSDGVGTKLKIAQLANKHSGVGQDLVAMCVNDVLTCGAEPLFFLDYFATGKLELKTAQVIIRSIAGACKAAGCLLLGGETAEMPGLYRKGEYDLAGFAVGVVEKKQIIDGTKIKPGNVFIGLPSSGLHSNGFSLVRKIFTKSELMARADELLKPTLIYADRILSVRRLDIRGIAHITGGGFIDNIPRILPENCRAVITKNAWQVPEIFKVIQKKGNISDKEMYRVFNMGIGMVLVIRPAEFPRIKKLIKDSVLIGWIEKCHGSSQARVILL
ncbi:MAG: phosphoribosylformylglycinamidine cyclo-ligase [Elusimicrobiota bacterium]